MDFIVDLLKYLEERHPVWGRKIATLLLILVGLAVAGIAFHYIVDYVLTPLRDWISVAAEAWRTHRAGDALSPAGWAGLLSGGLTTLMILALWNCAHRLIVWRQSRRLRHFQLRFRREYLGKKEEIHRLAEDLRADAQGLAEAAQAVRAQETADFEDFKRRWDELDKGHVDLRETFNKNKGRIDAMMAQVEEARDLLEKANTLLGRRIEAQTANLSVSPEPQPQSDTAPGTQP